MSEYDRELKEINDALVAAETALEHLDSAKEILTSASRWGIADILGGGLIVTAIKRDKMQKANREILAAQRALQIFNRELKDVRHLEIEVEMSSFLEFTDYFFDNAFMDFFTQRKISDARDRVDEAIVQIEALVEVLQDREEEIVEQLQ